jgi:hypothetical protein
MPSITVSGARDDDDEARVPRKDSQRPNFFCVTRRFEIQILKHITQNMTITHTYTLTYTLIEQGPTSFPSAPDACFLKRCENVLNSPFSDSVPLICLSWFEYIELVDRVGTPTKGGGNTLSRKSRYFSQFVFSVVVFCGNKINHNSLAPKKAAVQ